MAASGAASGANLKAVEAYLVEQHISTVSWHHTLNNNKYLQLSECKSIMCISASASES